MSDDLLERIRAEISAGRERVEQFQQEATRSYHEMQGRFEQYAAIVERIRESVGRPRIELLKTQFPGLETSVAQTREGRELTLHVRSELARITARLRVGHDDEIRHLLLDFDVEILPIFIRFEPHQRLEVPLDSVDEAAIGRWLDDRLVELVRTIVSLSFSDQYQHDFMVTDPVAQVSFPKQFAKTSRHKDGQTYYFVSDESAGEFDRRGD